MQARVSGRAERHDGDLTRGEEADALPGEAETTVHVEERVALAVEPAVEPADELGQVSRRASGKPWHRKLASVRVAGELQPRAEARRLGEAVRPVRQHDQRCAC